jgi:hypothetical protein
MLDQTQGGNMKAKSILSIVYFTLLVMTGCSYKAIPLKTVESSSYFVLQLEKADLYYPKEKVLDKSVELIQKETLQSRREEMLGIYQRLKQSDFKVLYVPEKVNNTSIKEEVENYLLLSLVQYELLKQGNVKVYNKLTKSFVNKINHKMQKSKLGDKGEVFSFPDGTEFYYHLIGVGE